MDLKELVIILLLACIIPSSVSKRSFGITRSRSKSKQHSVRRNHHGQGDYDMGPIPAPSNPKPSAPDLHHSANNKPIGWNVNNGHHGSNLQNQGHQNPPPYPGFNTFSSNSHPGYFGGYQPHSQQHAYGQPQNNHFMQSSSYYGLGGHQQPHFVPQQSPYLGTHGNSFTGAAPNGVMPAYGYGYGHYKQSSPFSLSNVLAGVALWQVGRSLTGGHHSHVYHHYDNNNNRQEDGSQYANPNPTVAPMLTTAANPQLAEYQNVGTNVRYGEFPTATPIHTEAHAPQNSTHSPINTHTIKPNSDDSPNSHSSTPFRIS